MTCQRTTQFVWRTSRTSPRASCSASRLSTPSGELLQVRAQMCPNILYRVEWPQTAYKNNNNNHNRERWIGKYFKSCKNISLSGHSQLYSSIFGILIKRIDISSICIRPFNLIACSLYNLDWKKDIAKYNRTFMKLPSELVTIRERERGESVRDRCLPDALLLLQKPKLRHTSHDLDKMYKHSVCWRTEEHELS